MAGAMVEQPLDGACKWKKLGPSRLAAVAEIGGNPSDRSSIDELVLSAPMRSRKIERPKTVGAPGS